MFKSVTLEVSLKPFKRTDASSIRSVCEQIFTQWHALIKDCETVSIMLWAADGSELLDYTGRLNESFEWCYWIGQAQLPYEQLRDAGDAISPHLKKYYYMDNPPVMTYQILKTIISTLKEVGKRHLPNTHIRVGETFDIGPEFAVSDFKYHRHKEVTEGSSDCDRFGFVDCTEAQGIEKLVSIADKRLYVGKTNGKNVIITS